MQLLATVFEFDPHLTVKTQQTPKPAAQFPSAEAPEPDLAAHSVAVMHVPLSVGSVDGVHVSCCKFNNRCNSWTLNAPKLGRLTHWLKLYIK